MRMNYAASMKARMVRRMIGPNPTAQADLARETGIPQATLSRWCREAGNLMPVPRKKRSVDLTPADLAPASPDKPRRPQDWTALERADVVLKASRLSAQELGEFLRSQGLHRETLREWTTALEESLSAQAPRSARALSDAKRIRELERDLARKDRALAETAALLILKKKMALFWGDEDDDTDPKSDE
jgi:transposase-like protein